MELVRAFYRDTQSFAMVHSFNHDQARFDFQQLLKLLGQRREGEAQGPQQPGAQGQT
jgi:hypothetical protein